ncbi:MAG: hypothetical protein JWL77_7116, partial [Chthonomonadaceae bacterium]|nr:hypothetical protein [Chthonomonadaceae bacterium]
EEDAKKGKEERKRQREEKQKQKKTETKVKTQKTKTQKEKEYSIEAVIDHNEVTGKYRIRWEGYEADADTWEDDNKERRYEQYFQDWLEKQRGLSKTAEKEE